MQSDSFVFVNIFRNQTCQRTIMNGLGWLNVITPQAFQNGPFLEHFEDQQARG